MPDSLRVIEREEIHAEEIFIFQPYRLCPGGCGFGHRPRQYLALSLSRGPVRGRKFSHYLSGSRCHIRIFFDGGRNRPGPEDPSVRHPGLPDPLERLYLRGNPDCRGSHDNFSLLCHHQRLGHQVFRSFPDRTGQGGSGRRLLRSLHFKACRAPGLVLYLPRSLYGGHPGWCRPWS